MANCKRSLLDHRTISHSQNPNKQAPHCLKKKSIYVDLSVAFKGKIKI